MSPLSDLLKSPAANREQKEAAPFLALLLAFFLFSIYLLTYSGRFHSSDGLTMFAMADSLARRGAADVNALRWMGLQQGTFGLDGSLYSRKGVGVSLLGLPLAWLGLAVPFWGVAQTFLLFNSLITAATGALLMLYIRRCGYALRAGLFGGLLYGLATMAWPYAKADFSDPLSGLLLLAAAYALLRYRQSGQISPAVWAGVACGLAVATRYASAALLPLFFILLIIYNRERGQGLGVLALLAFFAPLVVTALGLALYNVSRYGDPFQTGYLPQESFSAIWWQGILGLLFSPGRGLFLYSPVLLAAAVALPPALRRAKLESLLALSIFAAHVLLYGKWFMWHGGYAWGPRFLVPTLPFLVVLLAPLLERLGRDRPFLTLAVAMLTLLSVAVQLLGLAVDFRLYQDALLDTGLPLYAPVTFFDPRYSPLVGQLRYLRPENLDFAWAQGTPHLQIDAIALAVSVALVLITGQALALAWAGKRPALWPPLAVMVIAATGLLLARYHAAQPENYRALAAKVAEMERAGDLILLNIPEQTATFMNLYKGHLPLEGLNQGGPPLSPEATALLGSLRKEKRRIWFVPNWLPPLESGPELWLVANGYQAEANYFGEQRLALYGFPDGELPRRSSAVVFGGRIALRGYAFPPEAAPGDILTLELYWEALAPVERDYHVFIHLVDQAGDLVAQRDGQPVLWTRPTSGWSPGEEIEDKYGVLLPEALEPGPLFIRVGLYLPESGERLLTDGSGDFTELGAVTAAF
jgi:hypothetical protein